MGLDGMGWDGMGWDGMGWDGMGWGEVRWGGVMQWAKITRNIFDVFENLNSDHPYTEETSKHVASGQFLRTLQQHSVNAIVHSDVTAFIECY
ncbi:unnamed protein product [Toxocara canis]|uniref:PDEase domain-containing protein n=1 Tax=Toxocara canis TaxID=6265 RepID=A0A183UQU4_TOXCA|nr:unnamed protein product [Toxocara canis]